MQLIKLCAPVVGFEPTTISLTGSRSTIELHRSAEFYFFKLLGFFARGECALGAEPTTFSLTGSRTTAVLRRNICIII